MPDPRLIILIADDDQDDLELIEDGILDWEPDAQLHMVKTGKAAVNFLEQVPDADLPCLIILDYNMPELNGAEVLTILSGHSRYAAIPKVILSTSSSPIHMQECKRNGATAYFTKANTKREFDLLLKNILSFCNSDR